MTFISGFLRIFTTNDCSKNCPNEDYLSKSCVYAICLLKFQDNGFQIAYCKVSQSAEVKICLSELRAKYVFINR